MDYDCIIVGAGPAGIFAALELATRGDLRVLMVEKGRDLDKRERKEVFCGWGGAGTFSDGKLNLSKEVGGFLTDYVSPEELDGLIEYTDGLYVKFGAPDALKGVDSARISGFEESAAKSGLRLVPFPVRHIGTDRCIELLRNIQDEITGSGRVDVIFETDVTSILHEDGEARGVATSDGREIRSRFVLLSPGRSGSEWLKEAAGECGLSVENNPVDIGVRVEVPASILRSVTETLHEAKLTYTSKRFDDQVRTFCMNPYGVVVKEQGKDLCTVNGHSYSTKKSTNTNFAILVSTTFTEPFREPIAYGRYIARLANLLGEGIIVQRLGDLRHGRRSTPDRIRRGAVKPTLTDATPGDLSFVIPYRYISDILEMFEAMDRFAPGINSPSTLLYGVEVKFYSMRLRLTEKLETEMKNLFAAGDGAGVTRGIMHASVSGIIAAREILERAGSSVPGAPAT